VNDKRNLELKEITDLLNRAVYPGGVGLVLLGIGIVAIYSLLGPDFFRPFGLPMAAAGAGLGLRMVVEWLRSTPLVADDYVQAAQSQPASEESFQLIYGDVPGFETTPEGGYVLRKAPSDQPI
jgi:hypothetical protein